MRGWGHERLGMCERLMCERLGVWGCRSGGVREGENMTLLCYRT